MLITLIFSRFFHSNFIIQYLLFSTFLSYCTVLLYVVGSCKCRRGLSDPWNTCFHCAYCFSVFSDCLCFQNKLMMMMMMDFRPNSGNYLDPICDFLTTSCTTSSTQNAQVVQHAASRAYVQQFAQLLVQQFRNTFRFVSRVKVIDRFDP